MNVTISKSSLTSIDVVWVSYIRIAVASALNDLVIVAGDFTGAEKNRNINSNGVVQDLNVYFMGLVGFRIDANGNIKFKSTLFPNFTISLDPTPNLYNLSFILF